jgi:hypothetical protein
VVFVFASIDVLYYIYRFAYVEPPCTKGDLLMMDDLSDVLLDSVRQYFIDDFCIDVH